MNEISDQHLLRDYAEHQSEPAFNELLRRHIDFVYSAALRMVCDPHTAADVTQNTFIALTKNALQVRDRSVLSSWLHSTARHLAANNGQEPTDPSQLLPYLKTDEQKVALQKAIALRNSSAPTNK